MSQQGNVVLQQTPDGGEVTVSVGLIEMSGGLETDAYLSLFGGNEDYDGGADTSADFWGNIGAKTEINKHVSRTQNLLKALPATTANLLRVKEAVKLDLSWFIEHKIASLVEVVVTMPVLNKIQIDVRIEARGAEHSFNFTENWKAVT